MTMFRKFQPLEQAAIEAGHQRKALALDGGPVKDVAAFASFAREMRSK
jgi:hypothetical protein